MVRSVTVSRSDLEIPVGAESITTAIVDVVGGASQAVNWISGDSTIVSVSASGTSVTIRGLKAGGPVRVTATSAFDQSKSGFVTVRVIEDVSCAAREIAIGASVTGTLTASSCAGLSPFGGVADNYRFILSEQKTLQFTYSSADFPPALFPVNSKDQVRWFVRPTTHGLFAVLPAGTFNSAVFSNSPTKLGSYVFGIAERLPSDLCPVIVTVPNVSMSMSTYLSCGDYIATAEPKGTRYAQTFYVQGLAGSMLNVHVTSLEFSPLVEIFDLGADELAPCSASGDAGTAVSVSCKVRDGLGIINVTAREIGSHVGAFTITIDP